MLLLKMYNTLNHNVLTLKPETDHNQFNLLDNELRKDSTLRSKIPLPEKVRKALLQEDKSKRKENELV